MATFLRRAVTAQVTRKLGQRPRAPMLGPTEETLRQKLDSEAARFCAHREELSRRGPRRASKTGLSCSERRAPRHGAETEESSARPRKHKGAQASRSDASMPRSSLLAADPPNSDWDGATTSSREEESDGLEILLAAVERVNAAVGELPAAAAEARAGSVAKQVPAVVSASCRKAIRELAASPLQFGSRTHVTRVMLEGHPATIVTGDDAQALR